MSEKWRIDELQRITAKALQAIDVEGELSGRIRAVPDARTIRYYATIGLIDRPAEMRGRIAFYGRRHVLQLVCIKRLQFDGLSLNEIQQKLIGAPPQKLARIANLPNSFWPQHSPDPKTVAEDLVTEGFRARRSPTQERASFWAASAEPAGEIHDSTLPPIVCWRLPIAPNVSLEVSGVDPSHLTPAAKESLNPALQHLARTMETLGFIPTSQKPEPHPKTSNTRNDKESEL